MKQHAGVIVDSHTLDYGLGEDSPLSGLYELSGDILLIGVGYEKNTSLHLAEHRADYPAKTTKRSGAPIINENGERKWVLFDELGWNADDFPAIGRVYEESGGEFSKGKVGYAESILIPQREIVDFAIEWMGNYRA